MLNKLMLLLLFFSYGCTYKDIPLSKTYGNFKDFLYIQDASVEPINNIAASIVGRSENWAFSLRDYCDKSHKSDASSINEFTIVGDGETGTTIIKRISSRGYTIFRVVTYGIEDDQDSKETSFWFLRNGNWYVSDRMP